MLVCVCGGVQVRARADVCCCGAAGGAGYMRGCVSERVYREVKVLAIGGGATEVMKGAQGAARVLLS